MSFPLDMPVAQRPSSRFRFVGKNVFSPHSLETSRTGENAFFFFFYPTSRTVNERRRKSLLLFIFSLVYIRVYVRTTSGRGGEMINSKKNIRNVNARGRRFARLGKRVHARAYCAFSIFYYSLDLLEKFIFPRACGIEL